MPKVEIDIEALDGFVIEGLRNARDSMIEEIQESAVKYAETRKSVHLINIIDCSSRLLEVGNILEYYGG